MKAFFTPHFHQSYQKLPEEVKKVFIKQLHYLLKDLRHPSLRAKKYDEMQDIWQARVTKSYRFYFEQSEKQIYLFSDRKRNLHSARHYHPYSVKCFGNLKIRQVFRNQKQRGAMLPSFDVSQKTTYTDLFAAPSSCLSKVTKRALNFCARKISEASTNDRRCGNVL